MKKQKRPGLLIRIAIAHMVLLIVLGLSAVVIADRHWFTLLFAYAPPLLWLVPTLLLLPFVLWKRDRPSMLLLIAALLPQPYLLGWHFNLPMYSGETPLRVLTYNMEHGSGGVGRIAQVIRGSQAEVICLQETNAYKKFADPLPELRKALPEYTIVRTGEVAIATTLPLTNTRTLPMPGKRVALLGDVLWKGKRITVVAVHISTALDSESLSQHQGSARPAYLNRSYLARKDQVETLYTEIRLIPGPVVVCGDFNTPPRGYVYRRLTEIGQDAFAIVGTGFGWTFPSSFPVLRIDYIFTRRLHPQSIRTLPNCGSDHRPLLAELHL